MKQNPFWTKSITRLHKLHQNNFANYNWLFLPGGPGLGSESLKGLTELLSLPGAVWHVDLPGDGSNTTADDEQSFANWSKGLIEASRAMDNVILVTHSSGGMFALATPELEKNLSGLVLMDSAPNASWQIHFMKYIQNHPLPEVERLQKLYERKPSNDLLKKLTIASAPYFSIPENLNKIAELLSSLPFNYKTHQWTAHNFHRTYETKWIPQQIPTLIFSGDKDQLTPLTLFSQAIQFQRQNICIREIQNASHFPWIDNPEQVKQVFTEYCQTMALEYGTKLPDIIINNY
ncbi:MAG: alpha/beta hydrolase [Legionella sp.]|jgi:pimeloyl-ACP methyl ester carboxylesterase